MATVLHAETHAPLLSDEERVCAVAGVQKKFLYTSMTESCTEAVVGWVRGFRKHQQDGDPGLLLVGVDRPDTQCQAIAAAFVRNFIDARVIPVNTLLDAANAREVPTPTVLVIPNLYVSAIGGKTAMPAWKVQVLYDILLQRSTHGKLTVAYVENLSGVGPAYGGPFRDFLSHFTIIS